MDTRTKQKDSGKWLGIIIAFFVLLWFTQQSKAAEFYGNIGIGRSTLVLAGPYQWWQPEYDHDIKNRQLFGSIGAGVKFNRWVRTEFNYMPRIVEKDTSRHVRDECINKPLGPGEGSDGGSCYVETHQATGKVQIMGFSILPQYEYGHYRVFANFGINRVVARYDIKYDNANDFNEFGSRHWSKSIGTGVGYKDIELRFTKYDRVIADGGDRGGNGIYNGLTTIELKYIISFK